MGVSAEVGIKGDSGKTAWHLLEWEVLEDVVRVLMFGARKYPSEKNWQSVPNARVRYFDAAIRHLTAWQRGEKQDPETGLSHLSHAMCCLVFLGWFDMRGRP